MHPVLHVCCNITDYFEGGYTSLKLDMDHVLVSDITTMAKFILFCSTLVHGLFKIVLFKP